LQGMVPYTRKQIMGIKHNAKYIVTLTSEERKELLELVGKGKAAAQKIKHANILLASDENGENLSAAAVAKACHCHTKTVYNLRQRFVEQGLSAAIQRKKYATPGPRKMDGRTEARLVTLACEQTPDGVSRWSLRLLSEKMVDLGIVASISHETVRRTLKKTNCDLT
jgi:transposase